jgi:threonine dehydratase
MNDIVTYSDIEAASARLKKYAHLPPAAPMIDMPEVAAFTGAKSVTLVLDTPQAPNLGINGGHTFKLRGAANKIFHVLEEREKNHPNDNIALVVASAGNHAAGASAAANRAAKVGLLREGDSVDIFMPQNAPPIKQENTRRLGGGKITIRLEGSKFSETRAAAESYIRELQSQGKMVADIHPFDDKDVIAGQGTLGKEIFEHIKPDMLFASKGGGGLLSGLSVAGKELSPATQIIGAEPNYAPSGCAALMGKTIKRVPAQMPKDTPVAAGIMVKEIGWLPRKVLKQNQAHMHTVSQDMLLFTTLWLHRHLKNLTHKDENYAYDVELSGSAALAALLNAPRDMVAGKNIAVVVSGANREMTEEKLVEAVGKARLLKSAKDPSELINFPRQSTLCYPPVEEGAERMSL